MMMEVRKMGFASFGGGPMVRYKLRVVKLASRVMSRCLN